MAFYRGSRSSGDVDAGRPGPGIYIVDASKYFHARLWIVDASKYFHAVYLTFIGESICYAKGVRVRFMEDAGPVTCGSSIEP